MLLPLIFRSLEEDYWHLCESVQVWDVSCQRQVEITGPDTQKLVQLMTPRDLSQAELGQCFYAPLCDETGGMINDPILIKHSNNHWWLSIADSDVMLWAKGLATGFGLDALVKEPDIWPLAVQGPKAEELLSRVFGKEISKILFFRSRHLTTREQRCWWQDPVGANRVVSKFMLMMRSWEDNSGMNFLQKVKT